MEDPPRGVARTTLWLSIGGPLLVLGAPRPYKPVRTHAEAVAEIRRCAGSQFDPEVTEVFCRVMERLRREPAK